MGQLGDGKKITGESPEFQPQQMPKEATREVIHDLWQTLMQGAEDMHCATEERVTTVANKASKQTKLL